jgi:4'-phosphopantetheinyl transferase
VHLWLATPVELESHAAELVDILALDERERAERHRTFGGHAHFVIERATLRLLLSTYLGILPAAIQLRYGPHGKPELASGTRDGTLRFNLSHSHERALYAFVRRRQLGVDIERVRPLPDADRIASRWFSQAEQAALSALPEDERTAGFFRCWTRKEAYVKAVGGGISMSLSSFDVSLAPGEPARLLAMRDQIGELERWALHDLPEIMGYATALAVEGHGLTLRCWRWTEGTLERTLAALPWL